MTKARKLFKRSDGLCETGENEFAVIMLCSFRENKEGGFRWFRYKPSYTAPSVEIRWGLGVDIAMLEENVVKALTSKGYARNLTDQEVEQVNEMWAAEAKPPAKEKKTKDKK